MFSQVECLMPSYLVELGSQRGDLFSWGVIYTYIFIIYLLYIYILYIICILYIYYIYIYILTKMVHPRTHKWLSSPQL